jgi:hypothetical protein
MSSQNQVAGRYIDLLVGNGQDLKNSECQVGADVGG